MLQVVYFATCSPTCVHEGVSRLGAGGERTRDAVAWLYASIFAGQIEGRIEADESDMAADDEELW